MSFFVGEPGGANVSLFQLCCPSNRSCRDWAPFSAFPTIYSVLHFVQTPLLAYLSGKFSGKTLPNTYFHSLYGNKPPAHRASAQKFFPLHAPAKRFDPRTVP